MPGLRAQPWSARGLPSPPAWLCLHVRRLFPSGPEWFPFHRGRARLDRVLRMAGLKAGVRPPRTPSVSSSMSQGFSPATPGQTPLFLVSRDPCVPGALLLGVHIPKAHVAVGGPPIVPPQAHRAQDGTERTGHSGQGGTGWASPDCPPHGEPTPRRVTAVGGGKVPELSGAPAGIVAGLLPGSLYETVLGAPGPGPQTAVLCLWLQDVPTHSSRRETGLLRTCHLNWVTSTWGKPAFPMRGPCSP